VSETLLWVQTILSGSTLIALAGGLIYFGRLLQKVDDHDRRLDKVEEIVFPVQHVAIAGRR
jgi:hypothetical protein